MINQFSHLKDFPIPFIIDCGNGVANTVLCEILDKLNLNYIGFTSRTRWRISKSSSRSNK